MVLVDVDGSVEEVARLRADVLEAVDEDALLVWAPESAAEIASLWRWRDGVSIAVQVERGGKVSEDIVVPFDRLGEAIEETLAIGARHELPACSWGHAGDGNLHSTFLVDPAERGGARSARRRPRRSCSRWPRASAAASPASTASGSSRAVSCRGSGSRARWRCTMRSRRRSTPPGCSTPGRSVLAGRDFGFEQAACTRRSPRRPARPPP